MDDSILLLLHFPHFQVSPEGVTIRDEKVFRCAKDQNIPLLMLTSGGVFVLHSLTSSALTLELYSLRPTDDVFVLPLNLYSLRRLYEVKCSGHSKFNYQPLEEKLDRYWYPLYRN